MSAMSFTSPKPPVGWGITASVKGTGRNTATVRLHLQFGTHVSKLLPNRFDYRIGEEADFGKILLIPNDQGQWGIARREGRCWARIPPPPCVPEGWFFPTTHCDYTLAEKTLTLTLPKWSPP